MIAPDSGSPDSPDEPSGLEEGERVVDAGVLSERRARRAEAEVASLRRQLADECGDGGESEADPAGAPPEARGTAAEAALSASRVAAHRVEDLVALVSELDSQLPVLEARRRTAELGARRAEEARLAHERESGALRAEAERGALALRAAEERATSLREELAAAREEARAGADRELAARRVTRELVATATTALAQADSRLAAAEETARALAQEAGRETETRQAAQRDAAGARAQLDRERRELRHTEERLMRALAQSGARVRELEARWVGIRPLSASARGALATEERLRARTGSERARTATLGQEARLARSSTVRSAGGARLAPSPPAGRSNRAPRAVRPVAPGEGWLGRALVALVRRDPVAGADLALALLPLHGLYSGEAADWDLVLETSAWRVTSTEPGRLAEVTPLPGPRGRAAKFRLEADVAAFAALLSGAWPRDARRRGRLAVRGSRRRGRRTLRAIAATPLDLRSASRAGLWLDPGLAYLALARAISPAWTAEHRFVVAHELTGEHAGSWFVSVDGAAPLTVTATPPMEPAATVRCSDVAFLSLLTGEPPPRGEKAALRGDVDAIALLRTWVARAQRGPA